MSNKCYLYFLFCWLLLIIGCRNQQEQKKQEGTVIEVDLDKVTSTSFFSQMKNIELIPLETNDFCVFGIAHIMKVNKEYIAIVDQVSQEILLFTEKGQFVRKINKTGQGPEEYIRVDDFCFHPEKDHLFILDGIQNKILEYTVDGTFVAAKKLTLPISPKRLAYFSNHPFVVDKGIPFDQEEFEYSMFTLSEDLVIKKKLSPYEKASHFVLSPRQTIQQVGSQLFYLPVYSQTIFELSDNELIGLYSYSFGENDMNKDFLLDYSLNNPFDLLNKLESSAYIYFLNISIIEECILSDFMYKGKPYFHIYDRSSRQQTLFHDERMKDCNSTIIPLTNSENQFISLIRPDQLPSLYQYHKGEQQLSPNEDSNPIVIKYKF